MRWRGVIAGAALASAGLGVAVPAAAAAPAGGAAAVVRARFVATMPERFGFDADGDGLIDLPNSPAYVRPGGGSPCGAACGPLFTLRLDATESTAAMGGTALPVLSYRWEITGSVGRHLVRRGTAPRLEVPLPEGRYRVALEVEAALPWGTARGRSVREVVVEDLLIVAIGDSYASGEGNPERPRGEGDVPAAWADAPGDPVTEAAHAAAHRSTVAWPALAALALERADTGTSVTFVSVAASSARVEAGLLGPQSGVSPTGQLDQVAALTGRRRIDLLLVSIGGNDIGFARIVRGLVDADRLADPLCYGTDLQNVWEAALDGDWNRGSGLRFALPWGLGCRPTRTSGSPVLPGLQGLPAELDRLATAVERLGAAAVYLMEYPDPTGAGGKDGGCGEIVGDATPPFRFHEINRAEQEEGLARVVRPLNRILAEAASRHGWGFVGGVAEAFAAGHGYCGTRPEYPSNTGEPTPAGSAAWGADGTGWWYRHSAALDAAQALSGEGVAWYRTAEQSVVLQGPGGAWDTAGTMHPNELGHLAMARSLLGALPGD
jgi:lysophospholipase L1-like esterase